VGAVRKTGVHEEMSEKGFRWGAFFLYMILGLVALAFGQAVYAVYLMLSR
jgi:hypothetical protein|tara:strand:+ start:285 stop:434 length:150 start_codon:yes stop_codon:yes gene_type:complete